MSSPLHNLSENVYTGRSYCAHDNIRVAGDSIPAHGEVKILFHDNHWAPDASPELRAKHAQPIPYAEQKPRAQWASAKPVQMKRKVGRPPAPPKPKPEPKRGGRPMNLSAVPENILPLRRAGLNRRQIAEELGCNPALISHRMRGNAEWATFGHVMPESVADKLAVRVKAMKARGMSWLQIANEFGVSRTTARRAGAMKQTKGAK
jgi:DNA-binding CsgD family transcriptional regulator